MPSSRLILAFTLLLALLASAAPAAAAPGDLDPSFGTYGKYVSPLQGNTTGDEVVVQADGAVLVAGTSQFGLSTIFRFTPAGEPDPSFGENGRVVLPSAYGDPSIALQGTRIVVAASGEVERESHSVVYRLGSDGALDPTFGVNGMADTGQPGGGPQVAITPEQKIVLGISSFPIPGLIVARLLPDGEGFDPTFAGGVVYADAGPIARVQAVEAGPGDAVTILEATVAGPGDASRLLRFRTDGSLDPGFGAGGVAEIRPSSQPAYLNDLALRPDGSAIAVGRSTDFSTGVIAALTPNGQPDPGFGGDGGVEIDDDVFGGLNSVGIDDAGRVLATGSGTSGLRTPSLLLARYLPDGSADSTFGFDGRASAVINTRAITEGTALAIAGDGRIVVAAHRVTGFRSEHLVLGVMRFVVTDGPRDPDGDRVLERGDRCPLLGGPGRYHGCPMIPREVKFSVKKRTVSGTVSATDRACRGDGKALITQLRPGQDRVLSRRPISNPGKFKAHLGPNFEGRVYVRITVATDPLAGRCGPASSGTVSVG